MALPDLPEGWRFRAEGTSYFALHNPAGAMVGWAIRERSGRWMCVAVDGRERTTASQVGAGRELLRLAGQEPPT